MPPFSLPVACGRGVLFSFWVYLRRKEIPDIRFNGRIPELLTRGVHDNLIAVDFTIGDHAVRTITYLVLKADFYNFCFPHGTKEEEAAKTMVLVSSDAFFIISIYVV